MNFIPDFRILHDAGYNILAYDMRNYGHSACANGRVQSAGIFEARDVIGAQRYVRSHPVLGKMTVGLFSRCLGANATMMAMERSPQDFENIKCMVAVQPLSVRFVVEALIGKMGLSDKYAEFDFAQKLITGFDIEQMSPLKAAASVKVPTYIYQVRDDALTKPEDVQSVYDAISSEKEIEWIEGTSARWDGYCNFQRDPARKLAWFEKFMV